MRKNRVIEQNRCYHLVSRLAHRAFFLDDEEKDRAVALMRRVEAGVQASMSYCINRAVSISSDPFPRTITKNIDGTISKNHSSGGVKTAKTSPEVGENGHVERDVGNGTDSNPISNPISKESWEILKVISECRHISAEQIGRMLGLSASGVRYHIRALTSKSLIKRIGSSKTGHWEVVK